MYGRHGGVPPATENSNNCHAKVKCPHCSETGHIKENCRKWRQANPKLHVKVSTEPKRPRDGDKSTDKSDKPTTDVPGGLAATDDAFPFDEDQAVDGC